MSEACSRAGGVSLHRCRSVRFKRARARGGAGRGRGRASFIESGNALATRRRGGGGVAERDRHHTPLATHVAGQRRSTAWYYHYRASRGAAEPLASSGHLFTLAGCTPLHAGHLTSGGAALAMFVNPRGAHGLSQVYRFPLAAFTSLTADPLTADPPAPQRRVVRGARAAAGL